MNNQVALRLDVPRFDRLISLFQKHALMAYLVLAFLISWIFWFIEPGLLSENEVTSNFFIQLGIFGPIFAAMFVSAFQTSERQSTPP